MAFGLRSDEGIAPYKMRLSNTHDVGLGGGFTVFDTVA